MTKIEIIRQIIVCARAHFNEIAKFLFHKAWFHVKNAAYLRLIATAVHFPQI